MAKASMVKMVKVWREVVTICAAVSEMTATVEHLKTRQLIWDWLKKRLACFVIQQTQN